MYVQYHITTVHSFTCPNQDLIFVNWHTRNFPWKRNSWEQFSLSNIISSEDSFCLLVSFPTVCKPFRVIFLDFTGTFCLSVLPHKAFGKCQQRETARSLLRFTVSIQISGTSCKSAPVSFTPLQNDKAWSYRERKTEKNIRINAGFSESKNTLQNALQGMCRLYL